MSYFNDRLIEKLGLRHSDKNQSSYFDFWRNFFRVLYEPALLALDSPQFRPVADFFQSLNDPLSSRFLEKAYRRYHELKSASDLASLKISEAELDVLIQGAMAATKGVRSLDFQARHGATKLDPTIPTLVISADRDQVVIPPQIRDFKDVAATVQTLLLPKAKHIQHGPLEVGAYFQPASKAGGDWWWFSKISESRYRLVVGDVTGHGAGAAMVTALLAGCYQTISESMKDAPTEDVLRTLNKVLSDSCGERHWVTLLALEIDPIGHKAKAWSMAAP